MVQAAQRCWAINGWNGGARVALDRRAPPLCGRPAGAAYHCNCTWSGSTTSRRRTWRRTVLRIAVHQENSGAARRSTCARTAGSRSTTESALLAADRSEPRRRDEEGDPSDVLDPLNRQPCMNAAHRPRLGLLFLACGSICAAGRFASSRPDESIAGYSELFTLGVGRCGRGTPANRDRVNHFGRARR